MPTTDDHDIWFPDRSSPARDQTATFATMAQSVDDAITLSAEDVISRLAPQTVPNLGALPEEALLGEKRWVSDIGMEVTWAGSRWITSLPPNIYFAARPNETLSVAGAAENDIPAFTNVIESVGGITPGTWSYTLPYPGRYRVDAHVRATGISNPGILVQVGMRKMWDASYDFGTPLTVTAGSASARSGVTSEELELPAGASLSYFQLRKIGAASMNVTVPSWIRIRYMGIF